MNPEDALPANRKRAPVARRWIRQLHLWIGAWGALAAVLYGLTGLVMNHRFGDGAWPQGESLDGQAVELQVPAQARTSAEALSLWLQREHALEAQTIRKGPPRGAEAGAPEQWRLSGGNARHSWAMEYAPGDETVSVEHSRQTWLAAINRLHKAVGGGTAWILLADSFAIGMILLGLSGLWMWALGRSLRQMVFSVFAAGLVVFAVVMGSALA
ncbi:PepSY-associated TM helix domain-containing protein [Luteimonas vadosa]|uniref:PepSY-associated TM helix domain-containing protein n=1 Tax=Luteimonas vadosa TaxID=1165507 RepID=A0ABP9DX62_9GAMM